ncbi:MAG: pyruvate formate lyase family protein, partial [Smithellaceae bacterium]|nr:pyruvate formate lyase family protein [Smithellaceae bacterium]
MTHVLPATPPEAAPILEREGFIGSTPRIAAIRAELLATPYSICLERPKLLAAFARTEAGRRAGKEHPLVRRARALNYIFSHRRPRIYDNELIVGNMTSKRIASNYYVEGGSINILEDLYRLERRTIPLKLTATETAELLYWGLRNSFASVGAKALLRPDRLAYFLDFFRAKRHFVTEEAGVGHQVGNYRMVVQEGLRPTYEEANLRLDSGRMADGSALDSDQRAFYQSVVITIAGIRKMAENLAAEAEKMAYLPSVPEERRADLLES